MDVLDRIREQVENNPIIIYMKGTPQFPQCGFSSRAAAALQDCGEKFAYVNVLADAEIFENLPRFADWPTFPQVYIDGELVGGCDITLEMHQSGDLQRMVADAAKKWPSEESEG
ncbi:MAG: Grx4 family monothiol glutaredoxin [Gammaproteobacteria bacterium]|nr:Grx4 family monothiol glutaredoxin [Gammaproteobacteria bacterium]MCB1924046.1 Grx4 family monothiol glutaredoxin [Gammaproteobacteria bacterium]